MSKLLIIQIVFMLLLACSVVAIGMQVFGTGRINPDTLLPWAYGAAVGWCGALVCMVLRLSIRFRQWKAHRDE